MTIIIEYRQITDGVSEWVVTACVARREVSKTISATDRFEPFYITGTVKIACALRRVVAVSTANIQQLNSTQHTIRSDFLYRDHSCVCGYISACVSLQYHSRFAVFAFPMSQKKVCRKFHEGVGPYIKIFGKMCRIRKSMVALWELCMGLRLAPNWKSWVKFTPNV